MVKRYLSIDVLKTLGVLYLIVLHHGSWLFIIGDHGGLQFKESLPVVLGVGYYSGFVLGFQIPLLAGITFFFSLQDPRKGGQWVLMRALGLTGLGFLMNGLAWGVWHLFDWDVLQFVSISMIVSFIFMRLLPRIWNIVALLLLGCVALFFSNKFPFLSENPSYWYFILFGDPNGQSYWPFSPWFFIFSVGLFIGYLFMNHNEKIKYLMVPGAGLLLLAIGTGNFFPKMSIDNVWGPALFKPSPIFVLGITAGSFILIPLCQWSVERCKAIGIIFQKTGIIYLGKGILWAYIFSTIIGYRLTVKLVQYAHIQTYSQSMVAYFVLIGVSVILNTIICWGICHKKTNAYD